jgi:hypothetical protein
MITERAMLAAVHISIWTAVKHDRKVSRDVANQHGAHESAGRHNKQLLRGAEKLDALRTLAGQIRQHFYKITLPWSDEGYRLLPAYFYFELTTQMREFERVFSQSVDEFLEVYPSYIAQVRPDLNGLFREEDYPSAEKLRAKFGVKLEVLPIPSGNDFREKELLDSGGPRSNHQSVQSPGWLKPGWSEAMQGQVLECLAAGARERKRVSSRRKRWRSHSGFGWPKRCSLPCF